MAWPGSRSKRLSSANASASTLAEAVGDQDERTEQRRSGTRRSRVDKGGKKRMSILDLFNLSVSMGGAQIAWTVELGYGTPFLLSLGLSEQVTSLVWLAGPISGLVAQPIIGAISDSSTSKYRRRYWVVTSTIVLCLSMLILAYCEELASAFVDLFRGGEGDWDPERNADVSHTAIAFAVVAFYLLDFALNALQASLRNLLLDVTPRDQLSAGNAWHSRMTQVGNIVGFVFGFLPLAELPFINWLGGSQFRKFCVVAMVILVITIGITCWTQEEHGQVTVHNDEGRALVLRADILNNIYTAIINLPIPIRRVCFVQLFAFMGWFPFLFYSTTYIGQIMAYEQDEEPDAELATRTGALAMLLYSIVATFAGTLLPRFARRDPRLLSENDEGDDEDDELSKIEQTVRQWQADATHRGHRIRLPAMPLLLRDVWMGALLLFAFLTFSTFLVTRVWQAIILVSLVGICWAIACWVPFAIIMEFLRDIDREATGHANSHADPIPGGDLRQSREDEPLLQPRKKPIAGGTILGVHNLAIVMPQFVVALISSAIFRAVDAENVGVQEPGPQNSYYGKNGVAWVLRFGGLCALFGAAMCRTLPLTRAEKEMKRRLNLMRQLVIDGNVL
ncbi:MFS general substrate transporter [Vararia minispora EC-137]|uniref:MFS general substrate transporter n=1 Tax=Vararia minispora EC-137 TaxID=1314806 RepID=A0ACB8QYC2_9AGAM|nr:MFS general substrate transporter [Vararia minispora EC-137]